MKIETLKVSTLKPYEKNARKHPPAQVELLAKNIKSFGFTTPILIDEKNNIIAGHGRLLALIMLKQTEAPCVRMEGLTEEEVKALRLADNQVAALGGWDMNLVLEELGSLDIHLQELTGFGKEDLERMSVDDFSTNEEKESWKKEEMIECPHCNKIFQK